MLRQIALRLTGPSRRHASTAATAARAHTIYSPTIAALEQHLADIPSDPSSSTVYLISTSIDPSVLPPAITALQALHSSIGSFSVAPPGTEPSISIATLPRAKSFRTDLTGRQGAQVGRWQRSGAEAAEDTKGSIIGETEQVRREEGWAGLWKGDVSVSRIPGLEGARARSFLVLSDGAPRPVVHSLEAMFPGSSRIGLLSAPTPFLTGRPHTLIHGKDVYESGSIGLALEDELKTDISFGLRPLTEPFTIADAQGNMLLRFTESHGNPTQTLMAAIQSRDAGSFTNKDEEFFLSLRGEMVKILSGDPTRGAMSLDTEDPLIAGEKVQFMCRDRTTLALPTAGEILFGSLKKTDGGDEDVQVGTPRVVEGFAGWSEDGFIQGSAVCTVPAAHASWRI